MSIFQAFILGLVQGLGEFLPISSSGHLELVQTLFGINQNSSMALEVLLHHLSVRSDHAGRYSALVPREAQVHL